MNRAWERRIEQEATTALAGALAGRSFQRRGARLCRLVDSVWQSVLVASRPPDVAIHLEVASLRARVVMQDYRARLGIPIVDDRIPPVDHDLHRLVEPTRFQSGFPMWPWEGDHVAVIADMRSRVLEAIDAFLEPLSTERKLLERMRADYPNDPRRYAELLALSGDKEGVLAACAAIRRSSLAFDLAIPAGLSRRQIEKIERVVSATRDWRDPVSCLHRTLECADPGYKMDPSVLTDEFYATHENEPQQRATAVRNGLSPREMRELIRETLAYDDDPQITMIFNGVVYGRRALEALLRDAPPAGWHSRTESADP